MCEIDLTLVLHHCAVPGLACALIICHVRIPIYTTTSVMFISPMEYLLHPAQKVELKVAMTCQGCVGSVNRVLGRLEGAALPAKLSFFDLKHKHRRTIDMQLRNCVSASACVPGVPLVAVIGRPMCMVVRLHCSYGKPKRFITGSCSPYLLIARWINFRCGQGRHRPGV